MLSIKDLFMQFYKSQKKTHISLHTWITKFRATFLKIKFQIRHFRVLS
jgi:hypothetical protein